jgi:hypothetical protein
VAEEGFVASSFPLDGARWLAAAVNCLNLTDCMLTRRKLLHSALAISGTAALERAFGARQPIPVRVAPGTSVAAIPQNFVGLVYEMSSVARPGLLSSRNAPNVQLVRNLGREGTVRVGDIVADFGNSGGRAEKDCYHARVCKSCEGFWMRSAGLRYGV